MYDAMATHLITDIRSYITSRAFLSVQFLALLNIPSANLFIVYSMYKSFCCNSIPPCGTAICRVHCRPFLITWALTPTFCFGLTLVYMVLFGSFDGGVYVLLPGRFTIKCNSKVFCFKPKWHPVLQYY